MSDINVNQVLNQMRAMSLQAAGRPVQEAGGSTDFSSLLQQSLASVNDTQQRAGKMVEAFETGASNLSLAEVMFPFRPCFRSEINWLKLIKMS